jgi:ligand-binding sensor domain-containing protein
MSTNKKYFFVTLIIFLILIVSKFVLAQSNPALSEPVAQVQRIVGLNARFIVALISDGEGGAWIGTEDDGVWHCKVGENLNENSTLVNHSNHKNHSLDNFTTKNGLGDNNGYALAIDKLGRLWVGHLNSGVSVFNGKDWKNYDVVDGPIGERIFDIKICPKDGDVWMATSAGITRYKIDSDTWEHLTRGNSGGNLHENQASTLVRMG